jgi:uncharacterized protein (TIGR02466 family)
MTIVKRLCEHHFHCKADGSKSIHLRSVFMKHPSGLLAGSVAVLLAACSGPAPQQAADVIYSGGDILTMAGDQPQYVEALAVKDGHIVLAGSLADARGLTGKTTQQVKLHGRTLMPGFIDAHGHIADYTNFWGKPDLSPPPVGDTRSIDDIKAKVSAYLVESKATGDGLVLINGYDDSLLAEQRHPTRADLDQVSSTIPILVLHASGHLAVVNTRALSLAGLTKDSKDPPGGHMQRDRKTGDLNGVWQLHRHPTFAPLITTLAGHAAAYLERLGFERSLLALHIQRCWPVVSEQGQVVGRHHHPNAHLSAVYYLNGNGSGRSGCLRFFPPRQANELVPGLAVGHGGPIRGDAPAAAQWNAPWFDLAPRAGLLVLFPASVDHAVLENEDPNDSRFSISLDLVLTAPAGEEGASAEYLAPHPADWQAIDPLSAKKNNSPAS